MRLVAMAALLCAGCGTTLAALTNTPLPTAKVETLALHLTAQNAAVLTLQLQAPTPPKKQYEVRRVEWTLHLRGRPFAQGIATQGEVTLDDEGAEVKLQAPLTYLEAPKPGRADLQLRGSLTLAEGNDERTFLFEAKEKATLEPAEADR